MSEKVKLGDICNFVNGRAFKPSEWDKKGLPIVRIQNLNDENAEFNFCSKVIEDKYIIEDNQLLFSWSGTPGTSFGAFFWNRGKAVLNQHIFKVIPKININMEFLRYLLNGNLDIIISKSHGGVGLQHITKGELEKITVDIPKIEEQEHIVNSLNRITEIIRNKKEQIKQFNEIIKSQFVEMFQSGSYPKEELGKLCDVRDGTHDSPKYLEESGYKFITSKNIINSEIDFSEVKYISKQDYDRFNTRSKVNYGDILMPMIGTIGKPMIVNIPNDEIDFAIKNVALIKFLDNSKVTNIYIKNLFDSDYFENAILQNKRGGTQKFIALSDIRKMQIEIPPINLQNQFADIVKQIDKQKFESVIKAEKEIEKIQKNIFYKWGR